MAINQPPTNSTLAAIQTKARRITRNPTEAQLSTADLNQYINTFVLYDFPEHLRLFNLKTTLSFYTQPNVAVYESNTTNPDDPLYDFTNRYITVHSPVYVAGNPIRLSQSREEFFTYYPQNDYIISVGNGDGSTFTFTGLLPAVPVLRDNVNFTAVDSLGNGMVLYDVPDSGTTLTGDLFVSGSNVAAGTINYVTGAFSITFPSAPAANTPINSQTIPYMPSMPNVMLYFAGTFNLRPVPDQSYKVTMDVFQQPAQLLASSDVPLLSEFWQYIALGASIKIFQDRLDMDSVQLIMPEFKLQERLILRRTLVQQAQERSATIYQYGNSNAQSAGWYYGGSF